MSYLRGVGDDPPDTSTLSTGAGPMPNVSAGGAALAVFDIGIKIAALVYIVHLIRKK